MIDLSDNPCDITTLPNSGQEYVTSDYGLVTNPKQNVQFFPTFLYNFSRKDRAWYTHVNHIVYDCDINKSQKLCCFNRMPSWHRVYLYTLLVERPWFTNIFYTFGNHTADNDYRIENLSNEERSVFFKHQHRLPIGVVSTDTDQINDVGIGHPAYSQCAFNLVTETSVDIRFISEKTCKPFMACQIPIIVGPPGINTFLESIGLDMFSDLIIWKQWDNEPNARTRITMIVNFLDQFIKKDLVQIHQNLHVRIQQNKTYFHSIEFQKRLLNFVK
jgi:hypothetical protein